MPIFDIELNSAAHYPVGGIVELSPLVEEAGFGAIWKGESNSTDPLVLLSAIAARTRNLKLGTAIYHIYGRSPVTLGIQAATLQDLSAGRDGIDQTRFSRSGEKLLGEELADRISLPGIARDQPHCRLRDCLSDPL